MVTRTRTPFNGPTCFKCIHADTSRAVCDTDGTDIHGMAGMTCPEFVLNRDRWHTVTFQEWEWRVERSRHPQDTLDGYA